MRHFTSMWECEILSIHFGKTSKQSNNLPGRIPKIIYHLTPVSFNGIHGMPVTSLIVFSIIAKRVITPSRVKTVISNAISWRSCRCHHVTCSVINYTISLSDKYRGTFVFREWFATGYHRILILHSTLGSQNQLDTSEFDFLNSPEISKANLSISICMIRIYSGRKYQGSTTV